MAVFSQKNAERISKEIDSYAGFLYGNLGAQSVIFDFICVDDLPSRELMFFRLCNEFFEVTETGRKAHPWEDVRDGLV